VKPTVSIIKRSVVINGHKTSLSVEDDFWDGLKQIASERKQTISQTVRSIDETRRVGNLSSAIRVFVLQHYQQTLRNKTAETRQADRSPSE
jgi:predicted DNA-binding ribbon-helix-helix protein